MDCFMVSLPISLFQHFDSKKKISLLHTMGYGNFARIEYEIDGHGTCATTAICCEKLISFFFVVSLIFSPSFKLIYQ